MINDDDEVMLVPNGVLYLDITMSLVLAFCCYILELLLLSRRATFFAKIENVERGCKVSNGNILRLK